MFACADEIAALRDSAERFVADDGAPAGDRSRWSKIVDMGWLGAAVGENAGGFALPLSALSELAEALAPGLLAEPILGQLALGAWLLDQADASASRDAVLCGLLAGDHRVALAHHEHRAGARFATTPTTTLDNAGADFVLNGSKAAVVDAAGADRLLVSAQPVAAELPVMVVVAADQPGVTVSNAPAFDGRALADFTFSDVRVAAADCLTFARPVLVEIDLAQSLYAFLLASDSLGVVRVLLRDTHAYLAVREQFGTRLVELQALQHRLVDLQLALTRLESAVALARIRIDDAGVAGAARYIAAAKVQAAHVGRFVGTEAVQLHGAIGMTEELQVGRCLKRLTANALLGGTTTEHLTALGNALQHG